jgi:hypothetical protein
MDAKGSELQLLARHGQNDCVMALGRKNHLFAGSGSGGARWATICSLIETCKLNGVEPYAYLKDVLELMIEGFPANRVAELMPWAWKAYATTPV